MTWSAPALLCHTRQQRASQSPASKQASSGEHSPAGVRRTGPGRNKAHLPPAGRCTTWSAQALPCRTAAARLAKSCKQGSKQASKQRQTSRAQDTVRGPCIAAASLQDTSMHVLAPRLRQLLVCCLPAVPDGSAYSHIDSCLISNGAADRHCSRI